MANTRPVATIDWTVPEGEPNWLMGNGATRAEQAVVWAGAAAAAAALVAVAHGQDAGWSWWQWLLMLALALDVAGGVPANNLATAKRLYHSTVTTHLPTSHRLLRSHIGFSALHLHPLAVALVIDDATWQWATAWYLTSLVGTAAVVAAPLYLCRPLAAAIATVTIFAAPMLQSPAGLGWLGPVLVLKLVAAHAVREEPYRPRTTTRTGA